MAPTPSFRLRPPPLPDAVVDRSALTARILTTEPGGVCLISAAPGYGATTALAQAAAASADRVVWVALDATVDDAAARGLLAASLGATDAGVDAVLDTLAHGADCWLVVDGLDPHAHTGLWADLREICGRLPRTTRLAVASHVQLDAPARAVRLDEAHLQFGTDEAFDLVSALVPDVDVEDAGAIISAAEGWVAALVAAAVRLRGEAGSEWVQVRGAADLLGRWLSSLPQQQQDFLLTTAVLDDLSAGPAAAVTGLADAGRVLLDLEAAHAYLRPMEAPEGHTGRWWHRHGLLTAHLRERAGADAVARHSAAAEWFIAADDVARGMHHLIAAGRNADAGAFLTARESELLSQGRAERVLEWYDKISEAAYDDVARLLRVGWGQALTFDVRGADATLSRLAAVLAAQGEAAEDSTHSWVAEEALLRAYLAGFHADPAEMIAAGSRAVAAIAHVAVSDAVQLAPILVMRGQVWAGRPEDAARTHRMLGDRPFPHDLLRESHLAGAVALIEHANGYIRRAAVRTDAALAWLDRAGLDPVAILQFAPLQAQACVALDSGDPQVALDRATRILEQADSVGHAGESVFARLTIARVHMIRGDLGAALRALGEARALAVSQTPDSEMLVLLDQVQSRVHLAAGDALRAERLVRSLRPSVTRSLLWARVGLGRQPALARRTLEGIHGSTPRTEAERHVLLASVHLRTSRRMAQGHLRKAAEIAASHGLAQALVPAEPGIMELAHDTALEYQDDNLLWLVAARPAPLVQTTTQRPVRDLSRGELQLLALLPTRARNADIAQSLGISVNTVKTRLRRLYAKLGASDRDEAIARARERGLLEM